MNVSDLPPARPQTRLHAWTCWQRTCALAAGPPISLPRLAGSRPCPCKTHTTARNAATFSPHPTPPPVTGGTGSAGPSESHPSTRPPQRRTRSSRHASGQQTAPPPRRRPSVTAHRPGPCRRAVPAAGETRTSPGVRAGESSPVWSAPPAFAGQGAVSAGANRPRKQSKTAAIAVDNPRRHAMKNLMAPNIPLALTLVAALAAVALRAVARRPEAPGPAPVTVIAGHSRGQPQPAVTAERHDGTEGDMARPPAPPGRPASAVDQAQRVFHELHADGHHTSCAVCGSHYRAA